MTLARYITRLLITRLLGALVAITALLQIFDLFNNARDLLSRGGTVSDLLTYAALRTPLTVEQALPIAVLVGALATLLSITRTNEMIAMRSAGLTIYRILGIVLPTVVAAGLVHFLLIDQVAPWSERRFAEWWNSFEASVPASDRRAIWLRTADSVLRVRDVAPDGDGLRDIDIIRLSADGVVQQWVAAQSLQQDADGWMLHDLRTTSVRDGEVLVQVERRRAWSGTLDPASIAGAAMPTENLSTTQIRRMLQGTMAGTNSASYYATQLHRSYAMPLASLLMVLLAAPAAYMMGRRSQTKAGLAIGFGLGMAYLITDGLFGALGGAGVLPPIMAAWMPPVLFALIGTSVLLYYEE